MSECRGLSPTLSEVPGITFKLNGGSSSTNSLSQSINKNLKQTTLHQNGFKSIPKTSILGGKNPNHSKSMTNNHEAESCAGSSSNGSSSNSIYALITKPMSNNDAQICDMNGSKEYVNGIDKKSGGQGSPLRSQLGLNLKSNTPASNKSSPLQVKFNFQPCKYIIKVTQQNNTQKGVITQ